ncbi:hypothetical protein [Pareuzebyella sediminis]|uniref:hypothetical protein n=1 Tax=Pareuzebyella sediminis TaxID=2607998 RepID=UPI0018E173C8|nr:hypothetical protein [Pareuzebyella sediminis]
MKGQKDAKSYEKQLQKLKEDIEKGWNGKDSALSVQDIIDSKDPSQNEMESRKNFT